MKREQQQPRKKESALLCFVICIGAGILLIAVAFSRHVGVGNVEGECLITNSTIQRQSMEDGAARNDRFRPLFEATFMHDEETKFTHRAAVVKDGDWFSEEGSATDLQKDYYVGKNVFCTYKEEQEPANYFDYLLNSDNQDVIRLEDEPGKVPAKEGLLIAGSSLLVFGSVFFLVLLCKKSREYGSLV